MSQIMLGVSEPSAQYKGPALFAAGHRPFFLLCALSAVGFVLAWVHAYMGLLDLSSLWHGHEMVFGFATAAVAGFMMAAVPKWTNVDSPIGLKLALFAALWILGRVGMWVAEVYPSLDYLAWLDLLFLPVLSVVVARMITTAKNSRNYIVVLISVALMLCNFAYHFIDETAAVRAGIYMVLALAALISGRVIPAFTQNALRMHTSKEVTCSTPLWSHKVVLGLILLSGVLEFFEVPDMLYGGLATVTSVVLFIRMWNWKSLQTFFDPIVWILHVAYVWMPLGFGFKALATFSNVMDANAALHALTLGGMGMLILAVASRAALGHSGRALKASFLTVVSYILVMLSTFMRVFALSSDWVIVSGFLWVFGFGIFAFVYAPILIKPRVDGMPG